MCPVSLIDTYRTAVTLAGRRQLFWPIATKPGRLFTRPGKGFWMAAPEQGVKVFTDERNAGKSQVVAAAKAGIFERTGRQIEQQVGAGGCEPRSG